MEICARRHDFPLCLLFDVAREEDAVIAVHRAENNRDIVCVTRLFVAQRWRRPENIKDNTVAEINVDVWIWRQDAAVFFCVEEGDSPAQWEVGCD